MKTENDFKFNIIILKDEVFEILPGLRKRYCCSRKTFEDKRIETVEEMCRRKFDVPA